MSRFDEAMAEQAAPGIRDEFYRDGLVYTPKGGVAFPFVGQFRQVGQDTRFGETGEVQVALARVTADSAVIAASTRDDRIAVGGVEWEVVREVWRRGDMVQIEIQRAAQTERLANRETKRRLT